MARRIYYHRNAKDGLFYQTESNNMGYSKDEEKIVEKLKPYLNDDGQILYPGQEVPGSPVKVLLDWYFSNDRSKNKPLDADMFLDLIKEKNLFSTRWNKLYD